MNTNQHPASAILSVTTGILVLSKERGEDIYTLWGFLEYMTGEDLHAIQLPRAAEQCAPALRKQFPWADLTAEQVKAEGWENVLRRVEKVYGAFHKVLPLCEGEQALHDPMEELYAVLEKSGNKGAVTVVIAHIE